MEGNPSKLPTYMYRITSDDIIEFVDEAWVRFAVQNGQPSLAQEVIGQSLWKYVAGDQVRHLSQELLARVRQRKREATIPFRCDSPLVRRFMLMRVLPMANGGVEFVTWIEHEEPYSKPIPLLDATVSKNSDSFLSMCAWCKRIDVARCWREIDEAIAELRLFDRPAFPAITHGICDSCLKMMTRDLGSEMLEK